MRKSKEMEFNIGKSLPIFLFILALICKCTGNTPGNRTTTNFNTVTAEQTIRQDRIRRMRERYFNVSRNLRVYRIGQQMLETFDWDSFPVITNRRVLLNNLNLTSFVMETGKCYSSVCPRPEHQWNNPNSRIMKMKFDVIESTTDRIHNATLHLFMKSRTYCNCPDDAEQNTLNVRIYQYIPRGNRRRGRGRTGRRRRLIHTQMVPWTPNSWVSFPVTRAATDWVANSNRNLGLAVHVFDEFDTQVPARTVFQSVNCDRPPDMNCSEIELNVTLSPSLKIVQIDTFANQRRKRETGRNQLNLGKRRKTNFFSSRLNSNKKLLSMIHKTLIA